MNVRMLPWLTLTIVHFAIWSISVEKTIGVDASYYLSLLLIACLFGLGFFGLFPFDDQRKLRLRLKEQAAFAILLAWPLSCVNDMMNNGGPQFWYPTNTGLWAVIPVFLISGIAWYNGIRPAEN